MDILPNNSIRHSLKTYKNHISVRQSATTLMPMKKNDFASSFLCLFSLQQLLTHHLNWSFLIEHAFGGNKEPGTLKTEVLNLLQD